MSKKYEGRVGRFIIETDEYMRVHYTFSILSICLKFSIIKRGFFSIQPNQAQGPSTCYYSLHRTGH